MSDEPQPQEPKEGVAPEKPLPAATGEAEKPSGPARDEKADEGAETREPASATPTPTPAPSTEPEESARTKQEDSARAEQGEQGEQGERGGVGRTGEPTASEARSAQDRTASMARARQAARGGRTESDATTSATTSTGPDDAAPASGAAGGGGGGGSGAEKPQSPESTQVLRRVGAPRGPREDASNASAGAGQGPGEPRTPETTQVLRRVGAPRSGEPGVTGDPGGTGTKPGTASRAAGTAGALGAAGTAAAAGAGAANAAGQAGAAGSAAGAGTRRPGTGRTAPAAPASPPSSEDATALLAAADGPAGAPGGPGGPGDGGGKGGKGKKKRPKRTGWRRIIPTWRMVLGTFLFGVLLIIGLFFLGYSMVNIPPANALATKQSNVYLYADGSQLARDGQINRENVNLAQVSKDAQHAVLAAEDRDFYIESAVDPKAMLRAAWNTATGKGTQSGSTITQQYVKNYYLAQEQTVTRKAKEFFIAIKLDRQKSKNEILEGYLNTSYFGRNAYGIQSAAQAYYGVDAQNLDPARAAYLAALVNAPSEYDVVAHPENKAAAVARWNYVLDGMVKKGWLSAAKRAGMTFPMPKEQTVSTGMSGQRGYLVEAVKHYLTTNNILTDDQLATGGYRITTTIQKGRQDAFVKAVNDQLVAKLDKKNNKVDNYVRAGGASVDPKTGEVVAMYGGIDYVKQYTNGATRGDFQVGSTFKPFVFTSAVQNGSTTQDGRQITPNTMYDGTNERPVQGWSGGAYAPQNEDQKSYGQITVTKATDLSVNAVYAQMAVDVGPSKVKQTAIDLGIPSGTPDLQPYPSIALGTATASVLDMAEGYATLANHGKHGQYSLVKKLSRDGGTAEIKLPDPTVKQAVSREAADTTTAMLQSVVENGTASAAQAAGRPTAGKTGTAESDTAAWFAGYTPDLATVVAVMGQDPVTAQHKSLYGALGLPRINGGGAPTQIWTQYTQAALQGTPASDFDLQLASGADQPQEPSTGTSATPGTTGGQNTGGTTTSTPTTGGTTASPTTGGTTGTPTTGGTTTTGGGTGTTGATTTGGGTGTTGATTGGNTTTGGGTTGTDTTGGTTASPSGGTLGGGGTPGGGTAGTTTAGAGGGPGT